jgi:hypothetical protein
MDNSEIFRERQLRYVTAMYNGKPDRVPLRIFSEEFSAKYCGYSNYEVACNPELQFDINRKFAVETGIDAIQTNSVVNWFGMQKALNWQGINFPGFGISVDDVNQWMEPGKEEDAFLKETEFDELIDDPTGFLISKWVPRFTGMEPGKPGYSPYKQSAAWINGINAYNHFFNIWGRKHGELIEAGIVPAVSSVLKAPLDIIGDKLRGYVNLCYDLHERRDKVIAACEALVPHLANLVIGGADPTGTTPSIIWMHRGNTPFISKKDFRDIYWATLKPIIQELWAKGSQIILYAEGNWNENLYAIAELPEKSIIFHCDQTDPFLAHKILGEKFCISGGIPNTLLSYGTPDSVRGYCKKVIDGIAKDGGYIMDANALIMNDAKVENVKAMIDFTLDYGTYSQGSSNATIDEVKTIDHPLPTGFGDLYQRRQPGTIIPWEEKKKEFLDIQGDESIAKRDWEMVDRMGYNFCWVNLTW